MNHVLRLSQWRELVSPLEKHEMIVNIKSLAIHLLQRDIREMSLFCYFTAKNLHTIEQKHHKNGNSTFKNKNHFTCRINMHNRLIFGFTPDFSSSKRVNIICMSFMMW